MESFAARTRVTVRIAYGIGFLQPPRRIARVDVAFGGEAQDHFLALGIRHDALQDPLDDEILLHRVVALVLQGLVFGVIGDFEERLELEPLLRGEALQHEVFAQFDAQHAYIGVKYQRSHAVIIEGNEAREETATIGGKGGYGGKPWKFPSVREAARPEPSGERRFLTLVKALRR